MTLNETSPDGVAGKSEEAAWWDVNERERERERERQREKGAEKAEDGRAGPGRGQKVALWWPSAQVRYENRVTICKVQIHSDRKHIVLEERVEHDIALSSGRSRG
jgi:hypothetical protein